MFFYSNSSISWLKANQAYYHQVYYTKQNKTAPILEQKKNSYDFSVWWVNSISTATEWERKNHIQQKPILKNLYFLSLKLQLDGVCRMEYRRIYALFRKINGSVFFWWIMHWYREPFRQSHKYLSFAYLIDVRHLN